MAYFEERSKQPPGPINNPLQLQKLCVDNSGPKPQFLPFCDDFMNNLQVREEAREGVDYRIMSDLMFTYIYQIYGGTDIRRLSVQIRGGPAVEPGGGGSTDDDVSGCELVESRSAPETSSYEVEVYLRRIKVLMTPN